MLLVKTYIKESSIPGAGVGLFAAEFIPAGAKIFEEGGFTVRFSPEDFQKLPKLQQDFILTYGYIHSEDFCVSLDNDRFINHSENPNTREEPNEEPDSTYAVCDIQPGEEIFTDYRIIRCSLKF